MAKLSGLFKFTGTMDEVSAYKDKKGEIIVRRKGGVSKDRIMSGKQFQRTRENMSEFGASAQAGRIVRGALKSLSSDFADGLVGLLTQKMRKLIDLDTTNPRGQRVITTASLNGFEAGFRLFDKSLAEVVKVPAAIQFPGLDGTITANLPISGLTDIIAPAGATHLRAGLVMGVVNIEAEANKELVSAPGNWVSVTAPTAVTLSGNWNGAVEDGELMIACLYVEFAQLVNGGYYPLSGKYFEVKTALATA